MGEQEGSWLKPVASIALGWRTGLASPHVGRVHVIICCRGVSAQTHDEASDLIECLSHKYLSSSNMEMLIMVYSPNTASYDDFLRSSIQNLRFNSSAATTKPLLIIAPERETQVQASVLCCKEQGLHLRVRSGGHDYEGLSYISASPFVLLDLSHFRSIRVDDVDNTLAWVDSGATLGELYYAIAKSGPNLAFPAVPPIVTLFTVRRTLQQGATDLVTKWQSIADKLGEDLFVRVLLQKVDGTIQASFNSLFLGEPNELLPMIQKSFPELGLEAKDCEQMTWIQSVLEFAGYSATDPTEALLNKDPPFGKSPFKAKTDFVQEPIPKNALEGLWELFLGDSTELFKIIILDPLGGMMNRTSSSATPFPHREGNLYNIQYIVKWGDDGKNDEQHLEFMENLYSYMTPYVSKSPRGAYINYRDLDLGRNQEVRNYTSYMEATDWGLKYFKGNFWRLLEVKTAVDKDNFFRSEQSIPPMQTNSRDLRTVAEASAAKCCSQRANLGIVNMSHSILIIFYSIMNLMIFY
ncbi:hypothetical protein H6P81_019117 [Aristolochia fimbriata]|uniref:FAD-binding PCMH-type domain-containing protein n=1 Tax=Aristolochia fimbriata TaxID=158543 RepID=A0AAV7DQX9_ARIFI|nr:hypothetical protein H6P81_019117 [Aristolochia fimbriata]